MRLTGARLPLPIVLVAVLFAAALVLLLVSSLTPRNVATYVPDQASPPAGVLVTDTVTLDARDPDRWTWFAFGRGALVPPDTAGWDLAARRFRIVTAGAVARLDGVPFDSASRVPAAGYVATAWGRDTANPVLVRWYRYDFLSHLLRPASATYVLPARAGGHAKLEFLSYYCPGPEPGCVTFRYVYRSDTLRTF